MPPTDLQFLVTYIANLMGDIWANWGHSWSVGATIDFYMKGATVGAFGENGGLFYWWNEKLLWLLEQILGGLTFTSPL